MTSLKRSPTHLCVQGKEAESRMLGKPPVIIHHQVLEVVTNGNLIATLSKEICCSCWKQCRKSHREVPLRVELVDGSSSNGGPHKCGRIGAISEGNKYI